MKKWLQRMLMMVLIVFSISYIEERNGLEQINATGTVEKFVIVLDPGHGGRDPGVVRTHNGVTYYERDIVLKIAQYCKEELEKLEGVEVHLTRYNNASTLMDRLERTQLALSLGADVIVSLHINSTSATYSNVSGALVYCPYSDTESGRISQELAHKILKHLEGPGLKNRGLLVDEELGMIKYPKTSNVPGILVEHGFMNNPQDVYNYLSTDEKLKELGVADARGIIEYFSLTDSRTAAQLESVEVGKINLKKGTFRLRIHGLQAPEGIKESTVMVWNHDDKNDRYTYKAKLQKNGTYLVRGNIKNHKYHYGTYHYQVFATDSKEIVTEFTPAAFEVPIPELNFAVKSNKKGTKYTVSSDDLQGISKIKVAVWSENGGQDDLKWYSARKNKSNRWVKSIPVSEHHDVGSYCADFYGICQSGQEQYLGRISFEVPELSLTELKIKNLKIKAGTFNLYVKGIDTPAGVDKVIVNAWTKEDKSDIHTYKGKRITKRLYKVKIDIKNHRKQYGTYNIEVSVKDKRGFTIQRQTQQEFNLKENTKKQEQKVENSEEKPQTPGKNLQNSEEAQQALDKKQQIQGENTQDTEAETQESTQEPKEETQEGIQELKEETQESIQEPKEETQESIQELKEETQESTQELKEEIQESTQESKEETQESTQNSKEEN